MCIQRIKQRFSEVIYQEFKPTQLVIHSTKIFRADTWKSREAISHHNVPF